ncbi:methyltransferase family protein [Tsukamurella ocularis]|uniref:methyltransferase family protein n=1 Tax=Tsukamurella ocularis TaxID=1970234 RepID=UPI00216920C2|nr:methyltransferase [Tsukamurella ocularis]MCS3780278.1 protein-S-isoprenylcysteine O-methyltransferase Ste14 [Tsukamurella ocularis]MCS3786167.1 protein-S-isoprenylcysteine O-methyltransferase Ste14 [Tsukamurella ocularis]MCS3849531.1 protein-S-isoprenylcysteine O-methyltransferase Ste14 [Tsukamurella ocularis]
MPTDLPLDVLRPAVALVPWLLAAAAAVTADRPRRAGAALGTLWNAVALLALNAAAVRLGLWSFGTDEQPVTGSVWAGVPVDVVLGWAMLWGAVPVLLGAVVRPALTAAMLVAADLLAMASLAPLVVLGPGWLWGEAAAIAAALVPGLLLGELTARGRAILVRSWLQTVLFTAILAWVLPTVALGFAARGWGAALAAWPRPVLSLWIQAGLLLAIVAQRAVAEFAEHGGTPFPWDPPPRLVRTGPYAYLSNPMQACAAAILLIEAAALLEWRLVAAAALAAVFAAVLAARHEDDQLTARFGPSWVAYRRAVRAWIPRLRPIEGNAPAELWVSATCSVCAPVGAWFARRAPRQLTVRAAEEHPAGLRRVRYTRPDGPATASGLAAIGRGLEHLGLGWAVVGWTLRAPILAPVLQVAADAVGGGPRRLPRDGRT